MLKANHQIDHVSSTILATVNRTPCCNNSHAMRCTFSLWKSCHLRDGWPRSCSGFDLLALVPNFGLFSCRESTRSCLDGPMFLTQVSLRRPGTTVRLSCCDLGGVQTETTSLLASSSKSAYICPPLVHQFALFLSVGAKIGAESQNSWGLCRRTKNLVLNS